MSEMVKESGKLVPFKFSTDNLTIYEMTQELISAGVDIDVDDSIEYDCVSGRGIAIIHGTIYVIKDFMESNPDDGYTNITNNGDGTYNFDTVYYNGSSFLEEQLEEAFDDHDDAIILVRTVHDDTNIRVWDINLEDSDPKHIKNIARKELIKYMIQGVSKNAFLEDCDNSDVINEAYDSGELTNDMFYELLDELRDKMLYV